MLYNAFVAAFTELLNVHKNIFLERCDSKWYNCCSNRLLHSLTRKHANGREHRLYSVRITSNGFGIFIKMQLLRKKKYWRMIITTGRCLAVKISKSTKIYI